MAEPSDPPDDGAEDRELPASESTPPEDEHPSPPGEAHPTDGAPAPDEGTEHEDSSDEGEETALPPQPPEAGPSDGELLFAIAMCVLFMFGPIVVITRGYEQFTAQYGEPLEGAAGATLAIAVVMRTVSRTVLRTVVRTSARAGLRAGMRSVLRVFTRNLFASLFRSAFGSELGGGPKPTTPEGIRAANARSLMAASGLLALSWVVVVGFGQPFAELLSEEQAMAQLLEEKRRVAELKEARVSPDQTAHDLMVRKQELRTELVTLRQELRVTRSASRRERVEDLLAERQLDFLLTDSALQDALVASGNRVSAPEPPAPTELTRLEKLVEFLFTRAPFPGASDWGSMVIWGGAVVFLLPLWVIYWAQERAARSLGVVLRHETGVDGGFIQLYFAGAFSYMPLSSDVTIEGNEQQKGLVSLVGLWFPLLISVGLWGLWKASGGDNPVLLMGCDAFLIYPLVQTFPLSPLDGLNVWRWDRRIWFATFAVILTAFMLMGSEGLKHVI